MAFILGRYLNGLTTEAMCKCFLKLSSGGNTSWIINSEDETIKRIVATSMDCNGKADISFQVQLPDEWDPNLAKKNIGVSAFIETDRCNPAWIEAINKMDLVIVPSNHVKDIILKSGHVTKEVIVVPEWYFDEIDNDEIVDIDLDISTKFNFLTIATVYR